MIVTFYHKNLQTSVKNQTKHSRDESVRAISCSLCFGVDLPRVLRAHEQYDNSKEMALFGDGTDRQREREKEK